MTDANEVHHTFNTGTSYAICTGRLLENYWSTLAHSQATEPTHPLDSSPILSAPIRHLPAR